MSKVIANGSLVDDGWRRIRHRGDRCWGWNKFSSWNNQTYNSFVSQKSFQFYFSTLNWVTTELIDSLFDRSTSFFALSSSRKKGGGREERKGERKGEVNFRAIHAKNSHACKHGARFIRARNELLCIGNKEQWPEMRNKGNV